MALLGDYSSNESSEVIHVAATAGSNLTSGSISSSNRGSILERSNHE